MAVPKRKMSRSNTRHRRSQWKAVAPTLVTCANPACGAKHLLVVAPRVGALGAVENGLWGRVSGGHENFG